MFALTLAQSRTRVVAYQNVSRGLYSLKVICNDFFTKLIKSSF